MAILGPLALSGCLLDVLTGAMDVTSQTLAKANEPKAYEANESWQVEPGTQVAVGEEPEPIDGGRYGLFSSGYTARNDVMDGRALMLEMRCVSTGDGMVAAAIAGAPPGTYDISDQAQDRRQCVTMALCDYMNRCPDLYTFTAASMRGSENSEGLAWLRTFKGACKEVDLFGPALIEAEPALFEPVVQMRDQVQASYKKPTGSTGGLDDSCRVTDD